MGNEPSILSPQAIHWMAHLDLPQQDTIDLIKKACAFASAHEKESETPFSLSTLTQGLAMADVLIALQCDSVAIAAAIIYPTIFYQKEVSAASLLCIPAMRPQRI